MTDPMGGFYIIFSGCLFSHHFFCYSIHLFYTNSYTNHETESAKFLDPQPTGNNMICYFLLTRIVWVLGYLFPCLLDDVRRTYPTSLLPQGVSLRSVWFFLFCFFFISRVGEKRKGEENGRGENRNLFSFPGGDGCSSFLSRVDCWYVVCI